MGKVKYDSLMNNARDYFMIVIGLIFYGIGFTAFILPHGVVIGGVSGIGTLVYFASNQVIPVAITQYVVNLLLLAIAYRIVGRTFVLRTIFGATLVALSIGVFENFFMGLGHPIIKDTTMSVILGGIMCGFGVGTVFIHNGSTGGTDIVAAMVSRVSNVSIGRTMILTDLMIISCSIFLPFEGGLMERFEARVPIIVYGLSVTYIVAYMTDMLINTNRQATQFIILSKKWREIADAINHDAHRGVTVFDGEGWYTHQDVKALFVWCRKIESVTIFRIVKIIDEDAFITQANVNGVYGKGFDTNKVKIKSRHEHDEEHHEETAAAEA